MNSRTYCDGKNGDCRNTEHDEVLYVVVDRSVAEILVNKGWFSSIYNIHICSKCLENYYNKCDRQLELDENLWIVLGSDFKQKD